jgi:dissimilatory sulfite reductase (desulfoviridin) alpha/beta subunit
MNLLFENWEGVLAMDADYASLKKGGFMRQRQRDNFSMRLKVVGGNLTSGQLRTIADIAEKYGDGRAHLTSRQGVEIPFIKLRDIEAVKAALEDGGVSVGVCGPRVRTVTACQGSDICPSGCIETYPLAVEISERYFGRELPHKFKFGVTGCMNNCLKAEENDLGVKGGYALSWTRNDCTLCGVCVKACREGAISAEGGEIKLDKGRCNYCGRCVKSCPTDAWKGTPGYILSFGGLFGNRIAKGEEVTPIIASREELFRVADAALDFFAKYAAPGERFRAAIERKGWDFFKGEMEAVFMNDPAIDETVDITDVVCPVTFVKAKVALEDLDDGQILLVLMNDGEPVQNVPRSIKDEGHRILRLTDNEDGTYSLIVRKCGEQGA